MYRRYCACDRAYHPTCEERRPAGRAANPLAGLLPAGIDAGDLLLFGVLLLLYLDTGDEEFLIMLLASVM